MDLTVLREVVTVVSFVAFLGVVAYAVYPGNRQRFDAAARAPLDEVDPPSPQPSPRGEGANDGRGFANGSDS